MKKLRELLKSDFKAYNKKLDIINLVYSCIFSSNIRSVVTYRASSYMYRKKITLLSKFFKEMSIILNSCDIGIESSIGESFKIRHSVGIVISGDAKIGNNFAIGQNVTIGNKNGGAPIIGDNVTVHAGAIVIGNIKIGDNVIIGANSVVLKDIPNNSIVAGVPAKIIKRNK